MTGNEKTQYITFAIENRTGIGKYVLKDDNVYVYLTGQILIDNISTPVVFQFVPTVGSTPRNPAYVASVAAGSDATCVFSLDANVLTNILIDSSTLIAGGRLWFSTSNGLVAHDSGSTTYAMQQPTAGTASYYYDYVEFACSGGDVEGSVNVDTSQVDQFGFPISLTVSPSDRHFGSNCGITPSISRDEIIAAFSDYLTSNNFTSDWYTDCVYSGTNTDTPFALVNPSHVCLNQISRTGSWQGTFGAAAYTNSTDPTKSQWSVEFTLSGGSNPSKSWNGGYAIGTSIPNGTTVSGVTGSTPTLTLTIPSSAESNPFGPPGESITDFYVFYDSPDSSSDSKSSPFPSPLLTFFDEAIYNLFQADNLPIEIELSVPQPGSTPPANENIIFRSVVTTAMHNDKNHSLQSYTVLRFTGTAKPVPNSNASPVSYTYDVFYPFFSTNSMFSSPIYATANPPLPPLALVGNGSHNSPSTMVFACNGVFADSTYRFADGTQDQQNLAALENAVVSTLVRGTSQNLVYAIGTIAPNSDDPKTANVTLTSPTSLPASVVEGTNMFSFQLGSIPMTVTSVSADATPVQVLVSSPTDIPQTVSDLLTFSNFYPSDGTWSAYSGFWHNATVGALPIYIKNRGYTFAYDDQGGFSSDLTSQWKFKPTTVSITLNPWVSGD